MITFMNVDAFYLLIKNGLIGRVLSIKVDRLIEEELLIHFFIKTVSRTINEGSLVDILFK